MTLTEGAQQSQGTVNHRSQAWQTADQREAVADPSDPMHVPVLLESRFVCLPGPVCLLCFLTTLAVLWHAS